MPVGVATRGLPVTHSTREDAHVDDVKEVLRATCVVRDFGQRLSACVREILAESRPHSFLGMLDRVVHIHGDGLSGDIVETACLSDPVILPSKRSDSQWHEIESIPLLSRRSIFHVDLESG